MKQRRLQRNIPLLYVFRMLHMAVFFAPIIVVFFERNGLNMMQVMLLQTVFSVTLLVLEVPSGFIADITGRKVTLIIGSATLFIGVIVYSLGHSFLYFLVAEILWAIAGSLISGSDTAMLYDTLKATGREDDYKRIEGNAYSLMLIGGVISTTLGGFAAELDIRLPFYLTAALFALLLPVSLLLVEPPREKGGHERGRLYYFYKIHRFALYKNKEVRWLLLFGAVLTAFGITHFWLYQPYFELTGIPLFYFGLIFGLFNLVAAAASKWAHNIEKLLRKRISVILLPVLQGASPLLMAFILTPFSFLLIIPGQFVRGFGGPIIKDYINRHVWSDKRATVLSIMNLLSRVIFAISAPIIGWAVDVYSVQAALIALGIAALASGAVLVAVMLKDRVI
ncbi:MAG: MFS transporter [bacterium]|nr:MFS transporter [bacterium]